MFIWDLVTGKIWDDLMDIIYREVIKFLSEFFTYISNMGVDLFSLPFVQGFVLFFHYLGWALFAVGLIVAVFDTALESQNGQLKIKDLAINTIKGFFAVSLFTIVPVDLYAYCISLQGKFSQSLVALFGTRSTDVGTISSTILGSDIFLTPGFLNMFLLIAMGYCVLKIFFANIKRGGILLIMIAVGALYMFSILSSLAS